MTDPGAVSRIEGVTAAPNLPTYVFYAALDGGRVYEVESSGAVGEYTSPVQPAVDMLRIRLAPVQSTRGRHR